MLLIHRFLALLILLGMTMYGLWVVTMINDPTCSASPEMAGGVTRILQYISFCWIG